MSNAALFFETQTVRGVKSRIIIFDNAFINAIIADGGFISDLSHLYSVYEQLGGADLLSSCNAGKSGKLYFETDTEPFIRLDAVDAWYEVDYDLADFRTILNKKIFEHTISVHLHVPDATVQGYIDSFIGAKKGEFTITVERDTGSGYSVYLTAGLRADMITIGEQDFPRKVTLRARGLEFQRSYDVQIVQETTMSSLISAIALNLQTSLPIYTYNDWEIGAGTQDYFRTAFIDRYHLRAYESRTTDRPYTLYEALYALIPDGFGLWQRDGAWHLFNIEYVTRKGGVSLTRHKYTSSGAYEATDTSTILSAITGAVLPSSSRTLLANLKRITQTFTHNSLFSNLTFPLFITNNISSDTEVFEFTIFGLAQQRIILSTEARVLVAQTNQMAGNAQISIEIGSLHYNANTQRWNTGTVVPINIPIGGSDGVISGSRQIITAQIPQTVTDTVVKVTFRFAQVGVIGDDIIPTITQVQFRNSTGSVVAESNNNESDTFQAFADDDYLGSLTLPNRIFGQGPHPFSRAAIRTSTNALVLDWKVTGGTNKGYAAFLFERTFALHDDAEVGQFTLYTDQPLPVVFQFDGRAYFAFAGMRNESAGTWRVTAIRATPATRDFIDTVIPGPTPGPTPQLLTAETFTLSDDVLDREVPLNLRTQYLRSDGAYENEDAILINPLDPLLKVQGVAAPAGDFIFQTNGVETLVAGNILKPITELDEFTTRQDNYNLGVGYNFTVQTDFSFDPKGNTITGIAGGADGREVRLINRGSISVSFEHQSSDSTTSNRIITQDGSIFTLLPNRAVVLIYDSAVTRWRIIHN